jgi:beta-barrel assembly-enhancing protease
MTADVPRAAHLTARWAGRTGVLAVLLPLTGCISEKRELELGDQIAHEVNANVPLVRDAPLNAYVTDLGRLIASRSQRPELEYRFYIVDTESVNAFALPGGHIYVNRGLIQRTHNVSELAGVLAHEIGHVAARHGAKSLQRQLRTRSMSRFLYQTILGREPLLGEEALDVAGALWMAAHSRADEQEADRLAVQYLIDTGVDPRGMLTLFDEFHRDDDTAAASPLHAWFATHPASSARMTATRMAIRQRLRGRHPELAVQVPSYRQFMRRLADLPPADNEYWTPTLNPAPEPRRLRLISGAISRLRGDDAGDPLAAVSLARRMPPWMPTFQSP